MKANAVGKKYSEVERAYLAGLIDGDGAIMALIEPHNEKKFRFRVRIELKVTQKFRKDILFIPRSLGIGKIRSNRTTHDWITRDQKEILKILLLIKPFSKIKIKQIRIAIRIIKTNIKTLKDLNK